MNASRRDDERGTADERRRAAARSAATERTRDDLRRAERAGEAAERLPPSAVAPAARLPGVDRRSRAPTPTSRRDGDRGATISAARVPGEREQHADRGAEPDANADPVPRSHRRNRNRAGPSCVVRSRPPGGSCPNVPCSSSSRPSAPARPAGWRACSRTSRARSASGCRVSKVDVDERPELAERFHVDEVPALALVVGKRVVSRLDGRATAPKIESMLDEHLERRGRLGLLEPAITARPKSAARLPSIDAVVERDRDVPHPPDDDLAVADDRRARRSGGPRGSPPRGWLTSGVTKRPAALPALVTVNVPPRSSSGFERAGVRRLGEPPHLGVELVERAAVARRGRPGRRGPARSGRRRRGRSGRASTSSPPSTRAFSSGNSCSDSATRLEDERHEPLQVDVGEVALLDPGHGRDLAVRARQVLEHLRA